MVRQLAVVCSCLFLLVGCGGGDGAKSAPEKCDDLVDLMCVRVIACINDGTTQAECVAAAKTNLACAEADSVSGSYDTCMNELGDVPCATLTANDTLNLPASCQGVILFEQ